MLKFGTKLAWCRLKMEKFNEFEKVEEQKMITENAIKGFTNEEFGTIRTVLIDNVPWFVGKDVATILGYTNPNEAMTDHVDEKTNSIAKRYWVL